MTIIIGMIANHDCGIDEYHMELISNTQLNYPGEGAPGRTREKQLILNTRNEKRIKHVERGAYLRMELEFNQICR
jgi:hypothetical protein